jgi:tetratricopeptide (TPR) repeat protein
MFLILFFSCTSAREKTTPNEVEIFQRASHSYKNEDFEKLLKCFDSLISIDPLNGEYYFKRGYSKSMLLDDKGAVNDYKAAIKYNYNKKNLLS